MNANSTQKLFRRIAIFSFLLFGTALYAQDQKEIKGQTYLISDNGSVKDVQAYIDALNNSDMRNHRLLNKRYTIIFEGGLKVELFSATEISKSGIPINLSDYPETFASTRQEPVFALGENNFILEYHTSTNKHN
jgi:hypothetical protein